MILLLAEDEQYTRDGIVKSIDWAQLGIKEVYTAENGLEGLEIARACSPDIVLADIRMPRMNGAEMAREIRQILPNCALVFMSGYSDRDYFKSAIRLSALDYVSKPLDLDELNAILVKAVEHMKSSSEKEALVSTLKHQELASLLIQSEADREEAQRLWRQNDLPEGDGLSFYTLLLKQEYSKTMAAWIKEAAEKSGLRVLIGRWDDFYLLHAIVPSDRKGVLENFQDRLPSCSPAGKRTILAVGEPVDHFLRLRETFISARSAYARHFYHPECQLFVGRGRSLDIGYNPTHEIGQLLLKHPDQARQWVKEQFEHIRDFDGTPVELVQNWAFQIKTELSLLGTDRAVSEPEIPDGQAESWQKITSMTSLDQIMDFLLDGMDGMEQPGGSTANLPIVLDVQRYVQLHYADPLLTLDNIAQYVNLSLTYLCGIFKSSTGRTINRYLTDCRIRRAQLLLQTTHMRIREVAEASGYSGSNYFIKIFRKSTGLTPQEYKKRYSPI